MTTPGWRTERLESHGPFDKGLAVLTHPALPGLRVFVTPDRATLHNMRGDYLSDFREDMLKNPPTSHISRADLRAVQGREAA